MSFVIHNTKYTIHKILFYILLALLPTQLGYHWWPDWAFVLGRRIDYLSPTLYLTDFVIVGVFISWISTKFRDIQGGIAYTVLSIKKIHNTQYTILIIIGIFAVCNILFAANRMVAAFAWIKILELVGLGIYIVHTKPKIASIIFPLAIGALYSSVIAIVQFLLQHSIGGIFWFLGERTFTANTPGIARVDFNYTLYAIHYTLFKLRAYATFPHPNVLGGYLAVLLPAILQYSNTPIIKLSNAKKIFYFSTIILGIIALILTFSRSAWVIFVLSIAYCVFRKKRHVLLPVLVGTILIIFFIGKTFGFQDESVIVRQQLNAAAISMFRASPIIGSGLGNFLVRLPDYLVSRTIYFLQPVHNIYLLVLAETGVAGFIFFLLLLLKVVRYCVLRIPYSDPIRNTIYTILLLGLVDHYFFTLQQGQLLFTIFLSLSLIQ